MPFLHFRPEHDTRVDDLSDPIEWEDNALSNALAATSFYLLPKFCQSETHWSSRFSNYFYTTCPCCGFYRGLTVAAIPLIIIILILTALLIILIYNL